MSELESEVKVAIAVEVIEYVRRSAAQMRTARYNQLGIETAPSKLRGLGTGQVMVSAHMRNVKHDPHSYLRSALKEMKGAIQADLEKALTSTVGNFK